eukprot:c37364_g1_i1 orf=42-248(+)
MVSLPLKQQQQHSRYNAGFGCMHRLMKERQKLRCGDYIDLNKLRAMQGRNCKGLPGLPKAGSVRTDSN